MLTKGNQKAFDLGQNDRACVIRSDLENDDWYIDIVYFLKNLSFPPHLVDDKRRDLRFKSMKFYLNQVNWLEEP